MAKNNVTDSLSGADRALQIGMALLGACLLLGSLGIVINSALGPQRQAMVEVQELGRDVLGGRTRVVVEASNGGDITASAVMIEGRGANGDGATVTLDYVPGRSRKTATLTFAGDLGAAPVTLQAKGWVDP